MPPSVVTIGGKILRRIGSHGVNAATRIVGFFVSAMGTALIFHGIIEAMWQYGVLTNP